MQIKTKKKSSKKECKHVWLYDPFTDEDYCEYCGETRNGLKEQMFISTSDELYMKGFQR